MSRNLRQRNSAKVKLKDKFLDIRMLEIRTRRGGDYFFVATLDGITAALFSAAGKNKRL
jgi:hypothetical protein